MLTTYLNPQLTRLDVVTTEDGYLLVLNQVMELKKQKIEHVEAFIKEHKFKPIIMKKIAWNEPAQPAIRDDFFSSLIGPEVEPDKVVELLNKMQERVNSLDDETVSQSHFFCPVGDDQGSKRSHRNETTTDQTRGSSRLHGFQDWRSIRLR